MSRLDQTAHRPFPPPAAPWIMHQRWHDVLFAHWPFDPGEVLTALPSALRLFLDTYDGRPWVGVIAFWSLWLGRFLRAFRLYSN